MSELDDMMIHAMRDAYAHAAKMRAGSLPREPMRAVLEVLHKAGYRRCAEGQGTTQWCGEVERLRHDIERHIDSLAKAEAEVERLRKMRDGLGAACSLSAARAEKAEAEVERLRMSCEDYAQHKQRQDERILELQAEVERLRALALRWLRKWQMDIYPTPGMLDETRALIDAARGES